MNCSAFPSYVYISENHVFPEWWIKRFRGSRKQNCCSTIVGRLWKNLCVFQSTLHFVGGISEIALKKKVKSKNPFNRDSKNLRSNRKMSKEQYTVKCNCRLYYKLSSVLENQCTVSSPTLRFRMSVIRKIWKAKGKVIASEQRHRKRERERVLINFLK